MSDLSKRIAGLSPEKRAVLMQQLAAKRGQVEGLRIPVQPRESNRFPLSFAQQRLWFLEQLTPGQAGFNVTTAIRLRGPLDLAALRFALDSVVARHEILRTTFVSEDGLPSQAIAPAAPVPLPLEDLSGSPDRDERAGRLARQEAAQPVDLIHGPVVRARLLRLAETEHTLLVTLHHIVCDQWSLDLLLGELQALYAAKAGGAVPTLPPLEVQYADYAVWQREWLKADTREQLLAFWRRQLAGAPPLLELPTDAPRPPQPTYEGATIAFQLPPAALPGLHALARSESATMFMVLLAAVQALLARHSGQDDIVVGTPIANRTRSEIEPLVGLFLNTLVLRARCPGAITFRDLVRQVRESALDAYAHQELPFEVLVEELHPRRDLSYNPVFQVMFMFQNLPPAQDRPSALSWQPLDVEHATAAFDLSFSMMERDGRLLGQLTYNTDIFGAPRIQRLLSHLDHLIVAAAANPDQRIATLPLLDPAEAEQLRRLGDRGATAAPSVLTMHAVVREQAGRTPDAIALEAGAERLTYGEVERQSNQLAHILRAAGIQAEDRVGVLLERTPRMVVALLAILKSGAAYVPLDPRFPRQRLELISADANLRMLVTETAVADALPAHSGRRLLLDQIAEELRATPDTAPAIQVSPDQLAYVIYTSGSTGRPKGVQVPHRGVVNFLHSMAAEPGMAAGDTLLAVTTLAFDIAVLELFLPLAVGARVVILSRETAADGQLLAHALAAYRPTIMQATPTTWRLLFAAGWAGDPALTVLCGGEALPLDLAQALAGSCRRLWNVYGPTETTIWSTAGRVSPGAAAVSLGQPLANTRLYVTDRAGRLAPLGVPGELCIGGLGVARGYHQRPDLTADRFVPEPWSPEPGGRMYRTGDLVRWHADGARAGELEYLGRLDHQVKVRGYRIELGEIEAVVRHQPAVHDAAVVVEHDSAGDPFLAAYVVPTDGQLDASALRQGLRVQLPDYMVPARFIGLAALPLTPNGKIDRRALAQATPLVGEAVRALVPPATPLEERLADIWRALLGRPEISVTDDFFDLGGHSLLAVRLMNQIEKQLGRELPLAALFQGATIRQLAALLAGGELSWSPLVPIQSGGGKRPFFAVHAIGGNVLCYAELAAALGDDQPFYGLQAVDLADVAQEVRITEMAASYVAAMREVQSEGPYLLGGWSFGGIVAFEMARQLRAAGAEVEALVLLDSFPSEAIGKADEISDAMVLAVLAQEQALMLNATLPVALEELQLLPPEAQLERVLAAINAIDLDFDTEITWVKRFLAGYRKRERAVHTYEPGVYDGEIHLFRSQERDTHIEQIQARMGANWNSRSYGWERWTTRPVRIYDVPGYHHGIVVGTNAAHVAAQLAALFAAVHDRRAATNSGEATPGPL
ncbi:MAG TPA: amino acid adenylation domain-containing protein [Herpetosiphonaceae bacterium]